MLTDKNNPNTPKNVGELLLNTAVGAGTGAASGFIFGKVAEHVKIPGITSGRNSFDAIFRGKMTAGTHGKIGSVALKTLLKGIASQSIGGFLTGFKSEAKKQLNNFLSNTLLKFGKNLWDAFSNFSRRSLPGAMPLLPTDSRTSARCPLGA